MNVERFLHFWNNNDTVIIQSLVGCILLMVIYLAVRIFFGSQAEGSSEVSKSVSSLSPGMTQEIEKTLQKILENQTHGSAPSVVSAPMATSSEASAAVAPASGSNTEVPQLKAEIQARDQKLKQLEQQLAAQAAAAPAAGASADTAGLEEKIKDLESRLSEYEIISEDIADLSFYKEENARLQKELSGFKGSGEETAVEPEAQTPPAVAPAPVAAAAPPPPAVEPPPVASPEAASDAGIDDDIMKQFAAAVEEQKAATSTSQGDAPTQKAQVDTELLGKFEEFVKKS